MVKKVNKAEQSQAAAPTGLLDSQLAQSIKDSAQQIWLAGLGAFAKAQGEGSKVFDTLMKEGATLHRKTSSVAEEKLGDMAGKVSAMAGEVGHKATAQWDKLESIFEERTARAMNKLGVPTAKDVAALAERVDALAAAVGRLGKAELPAKAAVKPAARAVAKPAAEPAAKQAAKQATKSTAEPAATKPAAAKPTATRRTARKAASSAT